MQEEQQEPPRRADVGIDRSEKTLTSQEVPSLPAPAHLALLFQWIVKLFGQGGVLTALGARLYLFGSAVMVSST
jgi:hypothetical protein